MISSKIEFLIIKFLNDTISKTELIELDNWLKKPNNEELFKTYIKTKYAIDYNTKQFDFEKIKNAFSQEISRDKKTIQLRKTKRFLSYAAASVVLCLITFGYLFNKTNVDKTSKVSSNVLIGTDKAVLTLENGTYVVLKKGENYKTNNVVSNGKELIYNSIEKEEKKDKQLVYNYLTIPRGGQYSLKLSDGTKVWLNSETQIKYPVKFIEGKTRSVQLMYGEAYFDVSHSNLHNGSKFQVISNKQQIEVLGTEFNVKAYADESIINTTLVKGKIVITSGNNIQMLEPGEQASLDLIKNTIKIKKVDVYYDFAWKQGLFAFKNKPLSEIMNTLSRWYDVNLVFDNDQLKNIKFNGVLGKNQNIEFIIKEIQSFGIIESYTIKDNIIYLK